MRMKFVICLVSAIVLIWHHSSCLVSSNPIPYEAQNLSPLIAIPSMPMPASMMMGPQYDPYMTSMQTPAQYLISPPFGSMPGYDTNRRSNPGREKNRGPETDEQKALGDLPVSFLEPEAPSSISERLSDSFSAIGEGVRNHFRSLSENFSDTLDDLKDAWRLSEKRG